MKKRHLQPRGFRRKYFSLAAILALNSALLAQSQNTTLEDKASSLDAKSLKLSILHNHSLIDNQDFKETFDEETIRQSNAQNIYDFLKSHSLLHIKTSYGNSYTQSIDLRGFGINGHKNLAIIVDGIRYNNIDSSMVSLSAIPLDSISKIEIIRGKGTTKYGNGAVSGILKITTKAKNILHLSYASYDTLNSQFSSHYTSNTLNIGAFGQYYHTKGSRDIMSNSEEKDGSYNKNGGFSLAYYADNSLLLKAQSNYSKYSIKYANPLSKENFSTDPRQAGNGFTHQRRWDAHFNTGLTYFAKNGFVTDINIGGTSNKSEYINFSSIYKGKGLYANFNTQYKNSSYFTEFGTDLKTNQRRSNSALAEVEESLIYLYGEKYLQNLTLNTGINTQRVSSKNTAKTSNNLVGGELGLNYTLNPQTSLFASYSRSFVVPNVDFMFDINGNLNTLIHTATFDTLQIGSKTRFEIYEFSGNIFYTLGKDEAYYEPQTFQNKSLSKTQRIGGELKFTTHFRENLSSTLAYAYVDATMRNNEGYNYKGKTIPGVSKHIFNISANYFLIPNLNLGISYKYASRANDYNDFSNTLEKMPNYQSLDTSITYELKDFKLYAFAKNLTQHKNAIKVRNSYYPYEFETTFGAGVKYQF
ncbi:TonB-dependent receptor [Helicobacter mesocricetorum]|uniref:TonB-dependent receptor n=1 Tax=Helicobacter mesocricetorum TaxID=87012 RepID=UPI000CF1A92A|nr:TonB-dependent receptor [Helicobacter mesocricetorum]